MNKLIFFILIISFAACKKHPENAIPNNNQSTVLGTWKTTSVKVTLYENGIITFDTTVYPPYTGLVDVIETIRFTGDSVHFKMNNDTIEGESYKYSLTNNYILGTDSIWSDTLMYINHLSSADFDFTIEMLYDDEEYKPVSEIKSARVVEFYKSIKQ